MARLEEKLERFEQAVMAQAMEKSQNILHTMDEIKKNEISSAENSALSSAYELIQGEVSDITSGSAREISQKRLKQKQEYLLRRASYERQVFGAVRRRLIAYTGTDDYARYLSASAKSLAADYAGKDVTLTLKTAHSAYEPLVRESFGAPCTVTLSDTLAIGGLMLTDNQNGYVVDLSLDARLSDQRDWFYQNCKL